MNLKLALVAAALVGTGLCISAPPPPGDPAPVRDVSAPIAYKDLMLVLASKDGAGAVIFDDVSEDGNSIQFSFRYESVDGSKKLAGTGKLFERRLGPAGGFDPAGLWIKAGPISIEWSRGGKDRGWVYYAPEVVSVNLAHADRFKGRVEKRPPAAEELEIKELDLRRFMKK